MTRNELKIENSGGNQGIILGENHGNISFTLERAEKLPSLISTVVRSLGELCSRDDYIENGEDFLQYKPDEKLEYNCVVKYREIINEFSAYYSICDQRLNAYDNSNVNGKGKIMKCVHLWYMQAKGEILAENKQSGKSDIEIVREYSDQIIDTVKDRIYDIVKMAKEFDNTYIEDIELGIECFTCYCFMECKILEKPI